MKTATSLGVCADCGGEHHPKQDVSFMNLDNGSTVWCTCQCSNFMTRPNPLVTNGDKFNIIAGRWTGRTLTVNEWQPKAGMYIGTTLDYLGRPIVIHIPDLYTETPQ
jgi:hypothetical protein